MKMWIVLQFKCIIVVNVHFVNLVIGFQFQILAVAISVNFTSIMIKQQLSRSRNILKRFGLLVVTTLKFAIRFILPSVQGNKKCWCNLRD
jgi:hypothetical protein